MNSKKWMAWLLCWTGALALAQTTGGAIETSAGRIEVLGQNFQALAPIRAVYTTLAGVENSQPVTHSLVVDSSGGNNPENNPVVDPNTTATVAISAISDDTGTSASDFITSDNTLLITGSTAGFSAAAGGAGDKVHVVLTGNGVNIDRYLDVDGNGNWSLDNTANTLQDGTYTVTATLVDLAGNRVNPAAGGIATKTITVAHSANPVDPNANKTVTISAISDDTGVSNTDFYTADTTLTYSGTVSAGFNTSTGAIKVELLDNTGTVIDSAYVTPTGTSWSWTRATAHASGQYEVRATIVDLAGNTVSGTTTASHLLSVDTTLPTQSVNITAVNDNAGSVTGTVANGGTTDDTTLDLTGTLSATLGAGEVVQVFDGSTYLGNAVVNGTGWTFADSRTLANGAQPIYTAKVVDLAGNAGSASSAYSVTVNTNVPTITIGTIAGDTVNDTSALSGTYDASERGAAPTTVTTRPVISGTASNLDGQTITVTVNNHNYSTTVNNGTWSVALSTNNSDADAVALTLRDNLVLSDSWISNALIHDVLRKLGLYELVAAHPRGLDMPITEAGGGLSGGQRQLVSIARMMLRDPKMVFMDEPTANMDQNTEARVIAVLKDWLDGRTLLMSMPKAQQEKTLQALENFNARSRPISMVLVTREKSLRSASAAAAQPIQIAPGPLSDVWLHAYLTGVIATCRN